MIFGRVGLQTSLGKNKLMVYTIGFIWGKLRVAENKRRATGEGLMFKEQKKTRVSCEECGMAMSALLVHQHIEISHGIVMTHT